MPSLYLSSTSKRAPVCRMAMLLPLSGALFGNRLQSDWQGKPEAQPPVRLGRGEKGSTCLSPSTRLDFEGFSTLLLGCRFPFKPSNSSEDHSLNMSPKWTRLFSPGMRCTSLRSFPRAFDGFREQRGLTPKRRFRSLGFLGSMWIFSFLDVFCV